MALIQRRNDAAHDFLKPYGGAATQQEPSETPSLPSATKPTTEVEIINGEISQDPFAADHLIDRSAQIPPDDPVFEFESINVKACQDPSAAPLDVARGPRARPADPMFEARNFLKFLGLK
jgi:hypothetical protein